MSNKMKRISATFVGIALSLAPIPAGAAPAPATTDVEADNLVQGAPCSPIIGGGGPMGAECCYFPGQGWVWYYNIQGGGTCGGGYYQPPEEPSPRPSDAPTESPGQ